MSIYKLKKKMSLGNRERKIEIKSSLKIENLTDKLINLLDKSKEKMNLLATINSVIEYEQPCSLPVHVRQVFGTSPRFIDGVE